MHWGKHFCVRWAVWGEMESGLGVRRVKGVECILACKTEGEAFFRDAGILILFRLRKLGAVTLGESSNRVMDIPQDEVGHCSLSPGQGTDEVKAAVRRGGRSIYGRGHLHYSVILLKILLKDSPRESGIKKSKWNVTTENCH